MLANLAIYFGLILAYFPGLIFIGHRRRLLQFPVTSFTFLGLFVFNVVGSIFVIVPEFSRRDDYYRDEYAWLLVVQAVIFYFVVFPYAMFSKRKPREIEINPQVDRAFFAYLLGVIAGIIALYFVRVGYPPLLVILQGDLNLQDIIKIRTETVYGLPEFWLYNLGFTTIPLMASLYVLAVRAHSPGTLPRACWVIPICLCINALPGGKGNILDFCTALLIGYFLLSGWGNQQQEMSRLRNSHLRMSSEKPLTFSYAKTFFFLIAAFIPVLYMYKIYLGPMIEFGDLFSQLVYRIVGVYSESIAATVVYVEQRGLLGGATLPTVRGLFPHDRILLDSEMHMFMFGAPGSVTISGPMEGYLNFGWVGFIVFLLATFGSMIVIEEFVRSLRWTPLTLSILAFYGALATKVSQISLFAIFISLTYATLVLLLILVRKILVVWFEFGRVVRSPVLPDPHPAHSLNISVKR
ncbi:MAG: hypothetical protein Tsb009_10490 [Planctomycetaceae bacterium]